MNANLTAVAPTLADWAGQVLGRVVTPDEIRGIDTSIKIYNDPAVDEQPMGSQIVWVLVNNKWLELPENYQLKNLFE